jgi:hypothetical protein
MGTQALRAVGQIEGMEIDAKCRKYTAIVLSVLTGLYFTQESIFFSNGRLPFLRYYEYLVRYHVHHGIHPVSVPPLRSMRARVDL